MPTRRRLARWLDRGAPPGNATTPSPASKPLPKPVPRPAAPTEGEPPGERATGVWPTTQPPGALSDEAARALEALSVLAPGPAEPMLLGYHPVARTNPYQALLYGAAWGAGIAPLPILRTAGIDELTATAAPGHRTVLHLHWLGGVTADATSADEAMAASDAFLARLDALLAAGGRIVWTVHNVLPHGSRFEEAEARLRSEVADRADVVHILARATAAWVAPWFELPSERILHVPHPSYIGAYEDYLGRDQARHDLGIGPDELVLAAVGTIQPYKGTEELLDAWDSLPADRPRRLVIAGAPSAEPGVAELVERASRTPGVRLHRRRIPPSQMQVFLRAADVAVLPYQRSLNSGALMLALTFGVPVIVPAGGAFAELVDERYARTFRPDDGDGLAAALRSAHELATPAARAAARAAAEALDPDDLSRRFVRELRERLDRRFAAEATAPAAHGY